MPPEVAGLIANHIDSGELGASRLLFESSTRGPIHERNLVQRSFKLLIERESLPDIRLYDLRHRADSPIMPTSCKQSLLPARFARSSAPG